VKAEEEECGSKHSWDKKVTYRARIEMHPEWQLQALDDVKDTPYAAYCRICEIIINNRAPYGVNKVKSHVDHNEDHVFYTTHGYYFHLLGVAQSSKSSSCALSLLSPLNDLSRDVGLDLRSR